MKKYQIDWAQGSSPLTRGKQMSLPVLSLTGRLIPAHAGKTPGLHTATRSCPAHPRSRGENPRPRRRSRRAAGSSPLTRGKRRGTRGSSGGVRLIPAHAGKTSSRTRQSRSGPAHPRSRGENESKEEGDNVVNGSSPLTRGKRGAARLAPWGRGLIPAHAGKTRTGDVARGPTVAHPRSRGENMTKLTGFAAAPGSSPLTRGKHRRVRQITDLGWLIPAHAGKTAGLADLRREHAAHPRSRGENTTVYRDGIKAAGSSPLTRGKRRA